MKRTLAPKTIEALSVAVLVLLGAVLAIAVTPQGTPAGYFRFADLRALTLGSVAVPHAADVLSNLGFLVAGAGD